MGTKKSTVIANSELSPQVMNIAGTHGGRVRVLMDSFELATGDIDDDDIILLDRIPTSAVITGLWIMNDDMDSGGTPTLATDVGVYDTDSSVTVKDRNAFTSAVTTLQAATATWTDLLAEAGATALAFIGGQLWEWAGDASKPDLDTEYFIALTIETVAQTAVAGTLAYKIEYVLD